MYRWLTFHLEKEINRRGISTLDIVEKSGEKTIRSSAWRLACRKWLEENGLVSISKRQRVLPAFS